MWLITGSARGRGWCVMIGCVRPRLPAGREITTPTLHTADTWAHPGPSLVSTGPGRAVIGHWAHWWHLGLPGPAVTANMVTLRSILTWCLIQILVMSASSDPDTSLGHQLSAHLMCVFWFKVLSKLKIYLLVGLPMSILKSYLCQLIVFAH